MLSCGAWGLLVHRRFLEPYFVALTVLLALVAGGASAREGVSLPVSCEVNSDRVILQPSPPVAYEIVSERTREVYSACRPDSPTACKPILIYRFDVACGDERVQWMDLAAALLSTRGNQVSIKDDRLHIRPRPASGLGKCDSADPAFSFMKTCDPWVQEPSSTSEWILPPGFAPVHEVGARFLELPPAEVTPPAPVAAAEPTPNVVQPAIEFEAPTPVIVAESTTTEAIEPEQEVAAVESAPPQTASADVAAAAAEPPPALSYLGRGEALPVPPEPKSPDAQVASSSKSDISPSHRDAPAPLYAGERDLRMVSPMGWSTSMAAAVEEDVIPPQQPMLQYLSMLKDFGAKLAATVDPYFTSLQVFAGRLLQLRPEQEFTAALMGLALVSVLGSGLSWYSVRSRRTRVATLRMAEPQPMSFRPSAPSGSSPGTSSTSTAASSSAGTFLVPSDEKMCGELCRTAHTMLQQIDARVDELQGVAPLRRVLQREMRNLEQFLTAVMTASPAEAEEWRRMRNRLQRIVKELHRLRDIVEGAYRSLSAGGYTSREPRDKYEAYEVLGVNPDVSIRTLKKLVDALRACWHPDLAKDESDRLAREERMKRINIAWDIITSKRQEA